MPPFVGIFVAILGDGGKEVRAGTANGVETASSHDYRYAG